MGGNGMVLRATHRLGGHTLAVKVVPRHLAHRIAREEEVVRLLMASPHPLVVHTFDIYHTPLAVWYTMQCHRGGDLHSRLTLLPGSRLPAPHALFYFAEVASALQHLHRNGILYRDIKLENILLSSEGHALLADFGFAVVAGRSTSHCGTDVYVAPEMLRADHTDYGAEVDWWSAAVLLYRMLTGQYPFMGTGDGLDSAIREAPMRTHPLLRGRPKALVAAMLEKELPRRTYGLDAVRRHPCFQGWDWAAVEKGTAPPPRPPPAAPTDAAFCCGRLTADVSEEALLQQYAEFRKQWA